MSHWKFWVIGFLLVGGAVARGQQESSASPSFTQVDQQAIPLENLAYSYFLNAPEFSELKSVLSENGFARIQPLIAELRKDAADVRKLAFRARQTCTRLRKAKSREEFTGSLEEADRSQQAEMRRLARWVLSGIGNEDRRALERFLDGEYRPSFIRPKPDHEALSNSTEFPSSETSAIAETSCQAAAELESKAWR